MESVQDSLSSVCQISIWMYLFMKKLMKNIGFIGAQKVFEGHLFEKFPKFPEN